MRHSTIFALMILLSSSTFAKVEIPAGNQLMPECNLPSRFDDIRTLGVLQAAPSVLPTKTVMNPGKDLKVGDAVFYVRLQDAKTYYSISKPAEISDKSPFTPDTNIEAGTKYPVWAYYTYKPTGDRFVLLQIPSWGIPIITMDGKLCSNEVGKFNGELKLAGFPQAYQAPDSSFVKSIEPIENGNTMAVAITLKDADAASVSMEITFLRNGQVANKKTIGFDRMSGQGNIGSLAIQFEDGSDPKSIRIKSISEPDDWSTWLRKVLYQG